MSLLQVDETSVTFGGIKALQGATLEADVATVTGLIGPNGAGKTTLFNVITGLQPPTSGHIRLDDRDITHAKPHQRARLGIGRTFQRLEVFGSLTARDNVLVAAEIRNRWARDRESDPQALADELLERVGLSDVAHERVDALPTGPARLVELARALAARPRMLLLDEPSSGLNEEESKSLGELLVELADEGLGTLLVEHDVELVMRTCRQIFVLDYGQIIANGTPKEIQRNEAVKAAYLGAAEDDEA